MVRNDGSDSHFDTINRLHREQPEAAVEFIKRDDVIKRGAGFKLVGLRLSEGEKVRTEPIIADALEPFQARGESGQTSPWLIRSFVWLA